MDQLNLMHHVRVRHILILTGNLPSLADIRNKFSHTLTLFFLCTYVEQWPSFFNDLFSLIRHPESPSQPQFNRHVSLLLFHLITEISGEVADQTIKSARAFNPVRHTRDSRVRDAVRERDAPLINEAVLTIIVDGMERMTTLRKTVTSSTELSEAIEIVDWGIRTFGSYAGMRISCHYKVSWGLC